MRKWRWRKITRYKVKRKQDLCDGIRISYEIHSRNIFQIISFNISRSNSIILCRKFLNKKNVTDFQIPFSNLNLIIFFNVWCCYWGVMDGWWVEGYVLCRIKEITGQVIQLTFYLYKCAPYEALKLHYWYLILHQHCRFFWSSKCNYFLI